MSETLIEGQSELPLPTLKEEIRQLKQLKETIFYQAFVKDLQSEYEASVSLILGTVPQTLGDVNEREQQIGAAKWLKYASEWFDETLKENEQLLSEREASPIV